jgi:hypothetical protein
MEKMKAIGSRNLLKSYTKQREAQQEQLRSLIGDYMLCRFQLELTNTFSFLFLDV